MKSIFEGCAAAVLASKRSKPENLGEVRTRKDHLSFVVCLLLVRVCHKMAEIDTFKESHHVAEHLTARRA